MRKLDRYLMAPGCCFVCRSAQREGEDWILDLDRDITDGVFEEARIYLCPQCCMEIAHEAGCATPAMMDRFVAERDAAIRHATDLIAENEGLRTANVALAAVVPVLPVELAATGRYHCAECARDFQNPSALGRHRQARHGAKMPVVYRGDAALEPAEVDA